MKNVSMKYFEEFIFGSELRSLFLFQTYVLRGVVASLIRFSIGNCPKIWNVIVSSEDVLILRGKCAFPEKNL